MSIVPVRANSYMFDHGTRPAAMPRVTSPATWKRKPSTVSDGADPRPQQARAVARAGLEGRLGGALLIAELR